MGESKRLIVVGGGIGGITAAESARAQYPNDSITLLAAESRMFYNRIALGSLAMGARQPDQMHFYQPDWLAEQDIEARWGTPVEEVVPQRRALFTADGREENYDRLILATGASPQQWTENPDVMSMWTMDDALDLRADLKTRERIAVVGGGVLGVETALELARTGASVTLLEIRDHLLPLHLKPEPARILADHLLGSGVDLRLGRGVDRITRDGRLNRMTLSDGSKLESDLVLMMTGVTPNISLARTAGLNTGQGIKVDAHMFTSDPDILACGNCVEFEGQTDLLWNPARDQAEVAGTNAFERHVRFEAKPAIIHLKTPGIPLFVCEPRKRQSKADTPLEMQRNTDDTYVSLALSPVGTIESATMIGDTLGAHELERASRLGTEIPRELIESGDPGRVIDHLRGESSARDGWVCRMCGFTHEGEGPPETCPVCSVGKDQFLAA